MQDLEPKLVWHHFHAISQIPRCSGNEQALGEYILQLAERRDLPSQRDPIGNILVTCPGSQGMEARPMVILQGHTDMVCEKNSDTEHDFSRDPIGLLKDGEWITANGTTLGADNGIGVCFALALLDDPTIPHPPMELLFTVDEETALTGATGLSSGFLKGRRLINLDSEEEGVFYIGCAGGRDTVLRKKIDTRPSPPGHKAFRIKLGGLRGGHSGMNIDQDLGNAISLLSRLLFRLKDRTSFCLSSINGGNKHNAIPREAQAVITVEENDAPLLSSFITDMEKVFRTEYRYTDKDIFLDLEETEDVEKVLDPSLQKALIHFLYSVPHGVIAMSHAAPGVVETSTNMAVVKTANGLIELITSQRSSIASSSEDISDRIRALGELAGFEVEQHDSYPAWAPNPDSPLLGLARTTYEKMTGHEAEVKVVHAGLECGIFGEKFPGLDMISFGPTIQGAHSPDEKANIKSVENTWRFLLELLKRI
ncbi:MAG: aminoacyl-histidine dipeptidase [Deltaproteobacteria bacterium]|nr:aminoacyl-histidine dipeptidase [Deltaproteobacteria bacterium]